MISEETRLKMRLAKLGKKRPDMIGNSFKLGVKESIQTRLKKSEFLSKNPRKPWLGKKFSKEHRKKIGENGIFHGSTNPNWRGGVFPENKKIRKSIEYRLWREAVFSRDNFTCQDCGNRGGRLQAHHIKEFCLFPELRLAIDNGMTLCRECHKKPGLHNWKNNTKS